MSLVKNPILPGCHPDPSICRVGDEFFLVTSTFELFPGLPVHRSTDLAHWDVVGHVIDRAGQLDYERIPSSGGLYAPTLRHHDGLFWLVCTLVDPTDDARGGHFLMTATDAAGPWSEPIWLDADGIDPSIFFDDDGTVWVHGTRLAKEPRWHHQTEVWLRRYDVQQQALVGPEYILWYGALLGGVWAEGPHLYKIDGTYYLLAAEGGTDFEHAVMVARSAAVTGPYEGCKNNPVLTHRHLGRDSHITGTGHADLVQATDDSWWAVLLGMRPYGGYHYPLGRETFLVPVTWEAGWPVFAPGVGRVTDTVEVPFATTAGASLTDDQIVRPGDPRWTSLRGPVDRYATGEGDGWSMRPSAATLADATTPAFLAVRQQHRSFDVAVTLRAPLAHGEEAGLTIRQSENDHVRLAVLTSDAGEVVVRAVHRCSGHDHVVGEVRPGTAAGEPLRLGIEVRDADGVLTVASSDEVAWTVATVDERRLDSVAVGGFIGLLLGIYATSNGADSETVVHFGPLTYRPY